MTQELVLSEPMDKQTELMLKYGPKETTYCASFDIAEVPLITKLSEKIHSEFYGSSPTAMYYFDQLEKKWNDHHNIEIPFVEISKTHDIPTVQGLAWCAKIIINPGFLSWRYIGAGSDSREPRAYQQRLYAETLPRADMTVPAQGSISGGSATAGTWSLLFIGIFPSTFPTITVRESGVSNVIDNSGTFLNRNMFSSTPINHTVNVLGFTLATQINLISVTTWD